MTARPLPTIAEAYAPDAGVAELEKLRALVETLTGALTRACDVMIAIWGMLSVGEEIDLEKLRGEARAALEAANRAGEP